MQMEETAIEDILSFVSEPIPTPLEDLALLFIPVVPPRNKNLGFRVTLQFNEHSFANKKKNQFLNEIANKIHGEEIKSIRTFRQYKRSELERIGNESNLSRILIHTLHESFQIIAKGVPYVQEYNENVMENQTNCKRRKKSKKPRKDKEKKRKIS